MWLYYYSTADIDSSLYRMSCFMNKPDYHIHQIKDTDQLNLYAMIVQSFHFLNFQKF